LENPVYVHVQQSHTIPFGPKVLRIKSPIAMAPTNDDCTQTKQAAY